MNGLELLTKIRDAARTHLAEREAALEQTTESLERVAGKTPGLSVGRVLAVEALRNESFSLLGIAGARELVAMLDNLHDQLTQPKELH